MDIKKLIIEMVHSKAAKKNQVNEDMYSDLVKPFDTNPQPIKELELQGGEGNEEYKIVSVEEQGGGIVVVTLSRGLDTFVGSLEKVADGSEEFGTQEPTVSPETPVEPPIV